MNEYNEHRTAYKRYWSENWYLVPDGKKRAPVFWMGDGPYLHLSRYSMVTDDHINLLTQKDRVILLEAINAGCFEEMWGKMQNVLIQRGKDNFKTLLGFLEN